MSDLAAAKEAIGISVGAIVVIVMGFVGAWRAISRQRLGSATDENERKRLQDAFEASVAARKRAHQLANDMMTLQHRLGRLEAENEACNRRTDDLDRKVKSLEEQNERQANQIAILMRKKTIDPTASDFRGAPLR